MDAPLQPATNRRAYGFMTMWNWFQETKRALQKRVRDGQLPSPVEISNFLDIRRWAEEEGVQSVLQGLAEFDELVRQGAEQRERPSDEGERLSAERARQHVAAPRMEHAVRLLFDRGTGWVWIRPIPTPIPPGHILLFRFANYHDVRTLRGKLYSHDVGALEQEVVRLQQLATEALRRWQKDRSEDHKKQMNNSKTELRQADVRLRTIKGKLREARDPGSLVTLAIRHMSGGLQDYSPFTSLSGNPVPFIHSGNKVAQSIVRRPENYVPTDDFPEYPEPATGYRQAPYIVMMLVPVGELVTPEQIRSAMSAESDLSIIIQVGEHLYYKDDLERYVIAYAKNPF